MADKPPGLRFQWERAFLAGDFTKTQRVVGLVLATHFNKRHKLTRHSPQSPSCPAVSLSPSIERSRRSKPAGSYW